MNNSTGEKLRILPVLFIASVIFMLYVVGGRLSGDNSVVLVSGFRTQEPGAGGEYEVAGPSPDEATQTEGARLTKTASGKSDGDVRLNYPDGSPLYSGQVVNGRREGRWRFWDRQGHLFSIQTYANGTLEGPTEYYHSNGTVQLKGTLVNGERHGTWTTYDPQGRVVIVERFDTGTAVGVIDRYDSKGRSWLRIDAVTGKFLPKGPPLSPAQNGDEQEEEDCGCNA
ncbi:hypothetical protein OAS39_03985 [Pirellulales bacterium]|nr:hypothetical protein [Pirellulales bacterium]